MNHNPEIFSRLEGDWRQLSKQRIVFDPAIGDLTLSIPWQGDFTMPYSPYKQVEVSAFPKWELGEQQVSAKVSISDQDVIDRVRYALSGKKLSGMQPIRQTHIDTNRGSRMLEFIHPDDPITIYSVNGIGLVSLSATGTYAISSSNPELRYIDWLKQKGFPIDHIGSSYFQPNGEFLRIGNSCIAGAYSSESLQHKLEATEFAKASLRSVAEVPQVLWSGVDATSRFGLYISKHPLTIKTPAIFEISELYGLDMDIVSSYQNGEVMSVAHLDFIHNQTHHDNNGTILAEGYLPQFWKDFQTIKLRSEFSDTRDSETFWKGFPMSLSEEARLYDVAYYTMRLIPIFTERDKLLHVWKRRIAAFLYGYFGHDRMRSWVSDATSPIESIESFADDSISHVMHDIHPNSMTHNCAYLDTVSSVMQKTIMTIWIAIEREDSL